MLRRKTFFAISGLAATAIFAGGLVARSASEAPSPSEARVESAAPQTTASIPDQQAQTSVPSTEEQAAEAQLAFDRLLAEAVILKANYEDFKRRKSKMPVSLSAFRSLELKLRAIANADPSNSEALEWADAMRMAQLEILGPSVRIAASANRALYAQEMAARMREQGMKVTVAGAENNLVVFRSPHMTRQMAMNLAETAKIPEQARALQFRRVVFAGGRRSWSYDVARGRLR
jgi:hypothetical protein